MTKVLHISAAPAFGGSTKVILSICKFLTQQGFDVTLANSDSTTVSVFTSERIRCYSPKHLVRELNPIKDCLAVQELANYMKREQFDFVHTHTSKGGFIGRLAAKLAAVPHVVHTVQGFAFHEFSSRPATWFYKELEKLAARWCDRLILANEHHLNVATHMNIATPQQMVVIPNGIPPLAERPSGKSSRDLRQELGIPQSAFVLGAICRLARQKGLEYLIQAMPVILAKVETAYLLLVGEGELHSELQHLADSLNVSSNVLFTGFQMDVERFYDIMDAVVLPSLWEGLSITLLEAMRAGRPIVTTTIGSNLSVVRDQEHALLVPAANAKALAEATIRLYQEPELSQSLAHAALQEFKASYLEEHMLHKTYQLYLDLLEG